MDVVKEQELPLQPARGSVGDTAAIKSGCLPEWVSLDFLRTAQRSEACAHLCHVLIDSRCTESAPVQVRWVAQLAGQARSGSNGCAAADWSVDPLPCKATDAFDVDLSLIHI